MRSNPARAALVLGAVAALVVLFVVLKGGGNDNSGSTLSQGTLPVPAGRSGSRSGHKTAEPTRTIVVRGGKPAGGVQEVRLEKGDRARLVVRSDVADEVHVHGYDLMKDIPAGESVRFSFPATIEGVFEIELENRGEPIAELRVSPK